MKGSGSLLWMKRETKCIRNFKNIQLHNLYFIKLFISYKMLICQIKEYVNKLKDKHSQREVTVHLISHTHDDVGWLKTVDEYFSGSNEDVAQADVHTIINTVVDELLADPLKRFTYVEMKFFSMWWKDQTASMKVAVRQLVKEGRLEFVNAGWSMHDEACTHYEDIINNMMLGHQFLLEEFGVKPRIGWHVDPFGHSSANPRLFSDMGFDAWFFARLDFQDKAQRYQDHSMEFIWQPFFEHLNNSAQIYTYAMYDHYCYISGFDWDDKWYGSDPVVINEDLETFNADFKTNQFLAKAYEMLEVYNGDHILMTQGCDFTFANAHQNFLSLDRFIKYFNDHIDNVTVMYSTPGIYLDAIKAQNLSYPVKQDDMFPYADGANDYWTGYFTSRANSKGQVRDGQANLHASNKLHAMTMLDASTSDSDIKNILGAQYSMLDSLGIYQHHDAITGTARQHVADDYSLRMYNSIFNVNNPLYSKALQDMVISRQSPIKTADWMWCERLNGTYLDCPIANHQTKNFMIATHNPSLVDQKYIKAKVSHGNYDVKVWDASKQVFIAVSKAAVICAYREIENYQMINDCDLHIKTLIPANGFQLVQLTYNTKVDLTVQRYFYRKIGAS